MIGPPVHLPDQSPPCRGFYQGRKGQWFRLVPFERVSSTTTIASATHQTESPSTSKQASASFNAKAHHLPMDGPGSQINENREIGDGGNERVRQSAVKR